MSKCNNSKSTMITLRVPNFILNDMKKIQNFLGLSSLSTFIINTMSGEIVKYMGVIQNED